MGTNHKVTLVNGRLYLNALPLSCLSDTMLSTVGRLVTLDSRTLRAIALTAFFTLWREL